MKNLIYLCFFLSNITIGQTSSEPPFENVEGYVVHAQSNDTLRMMRIKLFINDTLRAAGASDFDAYFKLQTHRKLTHSDKVDLQFFYPRNFMQEVELEYPHFQKLLIKVSPETDISIGEIKTASFEGQFLNSLPNYLDCHPTLPIDPFEVKSTK